MDATSNITTAKNPLKSTDIVFSTDGTHKVVGDVDKFTLKNDDIIVSESGSVVEYHGGGRETVLLDNKDIGDATVHLTETPNDDNSTEAAQGKPTFWQRLWGVTTQDQKRDIFQTAGLGANGTVTNQFKGESAGVMKAVLDKAIADRKPALTTDDINTGKSNAGVIAGDEAFWTKYGGSESVTRKEMKKAVDESSSNGLKPETIAALKWFLEERPGQMARIDVNDTGYKDCSYTKKNFENYQADPDKPGEFKWGESQQEGDPVDEIVKKTASAGVPDGSSSTWDAATIKSAMANPNSELAQFKGFVAGKVSEGEPAKDTLQKYIDIDPATSEPFYKALTPAEKAAVDYYLKAPQDELDTNFGTPPAGGSSNTGDATDIKSKMADPNSDLAQFKGFVTDRVREGVPAKDVLQKYIDINPDTNEPFYKALTPAENAAVEYYLKAPQDELDSTFGTPSAAGSSSTWASQDDPKILVPKTEAERAKFSEMVTNGVAAAPEDAANFVKLDAHTPFGDFVRKTFTEFQTSDSKMSVRQILAGYQLGSFDTTPKELSVVKYYADSTLTDQELNDAFGIKTDASSEKTWASQDSAFLDMSSTQPDEPGDELKRVTEGKYYIKPSDVDAAKFASGDSGFKQFLQQKVNDGVAVDDVLKNYLAGKYRTNRQELGIADYYVNSGLDNDGIVKAFGLTKPVVPAEDVSDHKPGSPDFNEYTCLQTLTSNSLFNDTHETDTLNGRQAQNVNPLLNPFARESGADLNDLYRVAKGDGSADEVAAANWLLTRPGLLDRVMDGGKMSRESFKATLDAGVTKGAEITPNSDPFLKQTDIDKIEENSDAGKNAAKILFDLGPSVNSNGDQRYSYETLISIVNANNSEKLKNAARYVLSHPEMYHALCTDNNTNFDKNALEDYGR